MSLTSRLLQPPQNNNIEYWSQALRSLHLMDTNSTVAFHLDQLFYVGWVIYVFS